MLYLACDIRSLLYPDQLYGKAGAPVTIVSDRGGVYIVELKGGSRFSVLPNQMTDKPPADATGPVALVEDRPPAGSRRPHKAKPATAKGPPGGIPQGSLF